MSAQEWAAIGIGVLAASYLGWRALRRRLAGTCCGERECPAAREIVKRMQDAS